LEVSRVSRSAVGLEDLGTPGGGIRLAGRVAEIHLPRVAGELPAVAADPGGERLICGGHLVIGTDVGGDGNRSARQLGGMLARDVIIGVAAGAGCYAIAVRIARLGPGHAGRPRRR
jgi:hypothetical protein